MTKLPWTQSDAVAFREFYGKHPHLLDAMRDKKPKIEGNTTFESTALNSRFRDGYDKALEELQTLLEDQSASESESPFVDVSQD